MRNLSTGLRALWRRTDGVIALEFVAIVPVFLLFFFGVIEFARLLWFMNTMELAVAEGSRYGMIHRPAGCTDTTYAPNIVANTTFLGLDSSGFTVTAVPDWSSCNSSPAVVSVVLNVTHNFTFIAAGLLPFGPVTLTRQASFTVALNA